jgi:hypothetical protein
VTEYSTKRDNVMNKQAAIIWPCFLYKAKSSTVAEVDKTGVTFEDEVVLGLEVHEVKLGQNFLLLVWLSST